MASVVVEPVPAQVDIEDIELTVGTDRGRRGDHPPTRRATHALTWLPASAAILRARDLDRVARLGEAQEAHVGALQPGQIQPVAMGRIRHEANLEGEAAERLGRL